MAPSKPKFTVITAILLTLLFLFFRFYNISDSLFFFNDMGRDALVLQQWQETGKPPILGPQNSILPFNQSALYFYLLYPLFVLTGQSPLSALITNAILYLTAFLIGLYLLRRHPQIQKTLLFVFFLITISPQHIIQNRYIWNPSFITPFLVTAHISLYLLSVKFSKSLLWLYCLSLAAALSISFSIAPLFIVLFIFSLIIFRKQFFSFVGATAVSLILTNLPTLLFELKHHFILTKAVLNHNPPAQPSTDLVSKINSIGDFAIASPDSRLNLLILALTLLAVIYFAIKSKNEFNRQSSLILLATVILTLLIPVTIQAHYIFGLLVPFFIFIATLPKSVQLVFLGLITISSLRPSLLKSYFSPAPRTYAQMEACYKEFCQNHSYPVFVSVQSSYHPYHHGPEHRFLLKKQGCNVAAIETDPGLTDYMAVANDGGEYNHGISKYHELDLFGPSQIIETKECQPQLKIYLIKKAKGNLP